MLILIFITNILSFFTIDFVIFLIILHKSKKVKVLLYYQHIVNSSGLRVYVNYIFSVSWLGSLCQTRCAHRLIFPAQLPGSGHVLSYLILIIVTAASHASPCHVWQEIW